MNKMKLSAIVLGLAAAGAFAQNAPAAAPAAAPAQPAAEVNADSVKAAEEAKAIEAQKAEEAKKAEEEKKAAEAKKAEEEKAAAEAKKAEEEKAAAEAKKAEEEKAAAEAKKAEEAKSAEAAPAAENTNPGEVGAAASSAFAAIKESFSKPTSVANMEVKVSGSVEVDVEAGDLTETHVGHSYYTDAALSVDVKFNDSWSAHLGIDAFNDNGAGAGFAYDDAFVQYKPAEAFAIKVGDLRMEEGAFKSYANYDDVSVNAAGMIRHSIRGIEVDLAGLELSYGFSRNEDNGYTYNAHAAYEFNYAGQHLRPYFNYQSFQEAYHNEIHAGVDAGLNIGGFSFRAVYGLHMDYLLDDEDKGTPGYDYIKDGKAKTGDVTSMAHTFLAEPSFELGMFDIKTAVFFALISDGDAFIVKNENNNQEYAGEIPEYFFLYGELGFKLAEFIKLGIPAEFHTNTLDMDDDKSSFSFGASAYISPVENLDFTAYGMIDIAIGDKAPVEGDLGLRFGLETVFSF
ncbi:MAG: OprO/OprP family phosphate-selective porin [Fibrobacter sp.]|nr:OprO/OprP family phosphate-selective porin [Fibrobacter sp.]